MTTGSNLWCHVSSPQFAVLVISILKMLRKSEIHCLLHDGFKRCSFENIGAKGGKGGGVLKEDSEYFSQGSQNGILS